MTEKDLNPRHDMRTGKGHGRCHYCICRVCNLMKCKHRNRRELCLSCMILDNTPKLDCDGFESRYYHRVFKIKPEVLKPKRLTMREMVEDIHRMMEDTRRRGRWK